MYKNNLCNIWLQEKFHQTSTPQTHLAYYHIHFHVNLNDKTLHIPKFTYKDHIIPAMVQYDLLIFIQLLKNDYSHISTTWLPRYKAIII